MQISTKKYLVCIFLMFSIFLNGVAQEKIISFTWLDRSEKKMAGKVIINLVPELVSGFYQIDFTVSWYDQNGKVLSETSQMPFLGLSKYDIDLLPLQHIKCISFEQKKPFNLLFQSSGKLNLQVLNGYEGEIKITARFQYALSRDLYLNGRSELLDVMGNNTLNAEFHIAPQKKPSESEIVTANNEKLNSAGNLAIRNVAENYRKMQLVVQGFEDRKSNDIHSRPNYLQDLESVSVTIENARNQIKPDSLPEDSFQLYRDRYNRLNEVILNLRTDYLNFRIAQSDLTTASDPANRLRINDSLRNVVRLRFEPIAHYQLDSLILIARDQKSIATAVSSLITSAMGRNRDRMAMDSLILRHRLVASVFQGLKLTHDNTWNSYRIEIDGMLSIPEIDNLHSLFLKGQIDLQSAIDQFDNGVKSLVPVQAETPWYLSTRFLWTGLLALLILVVTSAVWSSSRNRKILKERLSFLELGNTANRKEGPMVTGIFSNEVQNDYFIESYDTSIPESSVGRINFHISSIKSVYQLVHGALLDRRGGDFGGYLFGNQYKLPGKGDARSEIFVEKICDSKYLRSTIKNEINARADLIDELNELIRQNKKFRLIGWFTSVTDASMEIPLDLMKIHQSFFKEKWQIGILLNPVSEVLQGACFLKRKSGFLDPIPDPAAFIKWDELYRFALNPGNSLKTDPDGTDKTKRVYSRIALNNNWGDSVITAVNFENAVVGDITAAASMQAIPKDTFQVVGYLYGSSVIQPVAEGKSTEYEVFIDRFIELSNELTPRDLPGLSLIGWWGQANVDVMNYLQNAVDYHEQLFREAYQVACLVNPSTGEMRIITRKHSMEMNNSTIETEEYSLKSLLSR